MDAILYTKKGVETTELVQGQLHCMSNDSMSCTKHIHADIENDHEARTC